MAWQVIEIGAFASNNFDAQLFEKGGEGGEYQAGNDGGGDDEPR